MNIPIFTKLFLMAPLSSQFDGIKSMSRLLLAGGSVLFSLVWTLVSGFVFPVAHSI
jgi:hypothetical protein